MPKNTCKTIASLLLLAVTLALATGCWSARQINQLAFISAIAVDQEDNGVKLTVQIIVGGGSEEGEGAGASVWVTSSRGVSLAEAVFNLSRSISKEIFWAHAYVVIFGEEYARAGIADALDWLGRERQMRNKVRLAVAQGSAEDILMIEPRMTPLPSEYIEEVLRIGYRTGSVPDAQLLPVRIAYANRPRYQIILPLVRVLEEDMTGGGSGGEDPAEGTEEPENKPEAIELAGSAVFKDDRLVGFLTPQETRGIAWLTGEVRDTLITMPARGGFVSQRVQFAKVSYELKTQDDSTVLVANISQDGTLQEWPATAGPITPAALQSLGTSLAVRIEEEVRLALSKLQKEFNSDCIGLGERLRRLDHNLFAELDWERDFARLELELNIEAAFRRIGLTK